MTTLEYILDGLEAELALERELGLRSVEIDPALLRVAPPSAAPIAAPVKVSTIERAPESAAVSPRPVVPASAAKLPRRVEAKVETDGKMLDFVFLTEGPLSPAAMELMSKAIAAMGKTAESAPIVSAPPFPSAKVYVVLGESVAKKFMPNIGLKFGVWAKTKLQRDAILARSPEEMVRFVSLPATQQMKREFWNLLKSVMQRVRL